MLRFGPEVGLQVPLPARMHRPGVTPPHRDDIKAPVNSSLDAQVTEQNYRYHDAYLYGFQLYRSGYYWEAHEVWEPVWLKCRPNSKERLLLQACIQLANAALKHALGNQKASGRLYDISSGLIEEILSRQDNDNPEEELLGVDIQDLARQVRSAVGST